MRKLVSRYKSWSLPTKIGIWSAIATFLGLMLTVAGLFISFETLTYTKKIWTHSNDSQTLAFSNAGLKNLVIVRMTIKQDQVFGYYTVRAGYSENVEDEISTPFTGKVTGSGSFEVDFGDKPAPYDMGPDKQGNASKDIWNLYPQDDGTRHLGINVHGRRYDVEPQPAWAYYKFLLEPVDPIRSNECGISTTC